MAATTRRMTTGKLGSHGDGSNLIATKQTLSPKPQNPELNRKVATPVPCGCSWRCWPRLAALLGRCV